jgi:hypothetical protein
MNILAEGDLISTALYLEDLFNYFNYFDNLNFLNKELLKKKECS